MYILALLFNLCENTGIICVNTGFWLIAWDGSAAKTKYISVNLINQPNHIKNWF